MPLKRSAPERESQKRDSFLKFQKYIVLGTKIQYNIKLRQSKLRFYGKNRKEFALQPESEKFRRTEETDSSSLDQQKENSPAEYGSRNLEIVTIKGAFWKPERNDSSDQADLEKIELFRTGWEIWQKTVK